MADTEKTPADQPNAPLNESDRAARRRIVKSAAVLVPSIVTLRARPAWAFGGTTSNGDGTGYNEDGVLVGSTGPDGTVRQAPEGEVEAGDFDSINTAFGSGESSFGSGETTFGSGQSTFGQDPAGTDGGL